GRRQRWRSEITWGPPAPIIVQIASPPRAAAGEPCVPYFAVVGAAAVSAEAVVAAGAAEAAAGAGAGCTGCSGAPAGATIGALAWIGAIVTDSMPVAGSSGTSSR